MHFPTGKLDTIKNGKGEKREMRGVMVTSDKVVLKAKSTEGDRDGHLIKTMVTTHSEDRMAVNTFVPNRIRVTESKKAYGCARRQDHISG